MTNNRKLEDFLASYQNSAPKVNEPSVDQLHSLLELDQNTPFSFINLLKYRDTASYPAESHYASDEISGRTAYQRYSFVALEEITKRGGKLLSANEVKLQLIGDSSMWDAVVTLIGDFDNSGAVGQSDLKAVLLNWGSTTVPAGFEVGALTAGVFDGNMSQNELNDVLLNWGNTAEISGVAVPEPATVLTVGVLGGLGLARRRRMAAR